ncbi:hypothetical protein [Spirobacillus cienkowskii]|uniref:hypothetical protein n=1 Tax=Spirobacillus cienkowskii TaxID=495820 RepID=UPI0030D43972
MLLKNEKDIAKEIAEKLLTIMTDGMINIFVRFMPYESNYGYSIILNYTKTDGYIAYYNEEDATLIKSDFREVRTYIGKLLLQFREKTQGKWERCIAWVNKDGDCDIDFLYL